MRRSVKMPDLAYHIARRYRSDTEKDTMYGLRGIHSGFTIVEIVIVVVIIAIAALVAVPMMSSAASLQIRSAANMIAADLEYAKSMAISRGQNYSVVFDKDADSYRIEDQVGNVIQHPVKKGFTYVIDFQNESRLNRVDISTAVFDTDQTVVFDCLGSPDSGGSVILQADGATKTITVEPVTGFISIQ
jgi:prepilin-type N-terminal cleavage/methylation domain-containing protein